MMSSLQVCEGDSNDDVIASHRVQAFPTIAFFVGGNEKQRIKGADTNAIQAAVAALKPAEAFQGTGATLGGSGSGSLSPAQAREARLAALGGSRPSTADSHTKVASPTGSAEAMASDEDVMAGVTATSPVPSAGAQGGVGGASEAPPAASAGSSDAASASDAAEPPVDAQALQQLLDMGFGRNRCVRALYATGKSTGTFDLSTALEWVSQHEGDADIDEPLVLSKRARTGAAEHGNSAAEDEEDAAATSSMSAEEKKEYLKAKLAQRRAEKDAAEKEDAKARELARRTEGQGMVAAKEEFEAKQRRLHREQLAREKRAAAEERERIRKSLAQDKLEKLALQYGGVANVPAEKAKPLQDAIAGVNPADAMPPAERMDAAIVKIARHKVDNAGVKSLKTLRKLIGNIVTNPAEEKFQRINLANRVIKERITTLAGGIMFLSAAGFARPEGGGDEMALLGDLGSERLQLALQKLDAALA